MTEENRKESSNDETAGSSSHGALWVALVMGGLLAMIFIGDYLKSLP
jgi:hypothetical protein